MYSILIPFLGLGGGRMSWSLQQRFLRTVPRQERVNNLERRGQVHTGMGYDQKDMLAHIPQGKRYGEVRYNFNL